MKEYEYVKEYVQGDLVQYQKTPKDMNKVQFGVVAMGAVYKVGLNDYSMLNIDRYQRVANGYEKSIDETRFLHVIRNFGQISFHDFFEQNPEYFI